MASSKKRRSLSCSAEFIARNDDLLVQIFLRLPAKTVLSLQTVNKHWHSIISSPEFRRIHSHHNFSFSPSGLFLYDPFNPKSSKSIIFDSDGCPTTSSSSSIFPTKHSQNILESCNGLFLCHSGLFLGSQTTKLYVCNPTTKQSALLPSSGAAENELCFTMSLAFDPSFSPHYKVIHLWWSESSFKFHSQVYSSETCNWKPSNHVPSTGSCGNGYFGRGVYCNRAIHWMHGSDHLVYYKTSENCLNVVGLPSRRTEMESMVMYTILAATQNNLIFVENIYNESHQLLVFELDTDYLEFIQKYSVTVNEVLRSLPDVDHHSYHLLSAFQGAEKEDVVIVVSIRGNVIAHHTRDNSSEILPGLHSKAKRRPIMRYAVYNYVESLHPV